MSKEAAKIENFLKEKKSKENAKNKVLTSLDEMFGNISGMDSVELDINLLDPYKDHLFTPYMDDRLDAMVESIKEFGVIQPVIVRQKLDDRYEILSGHNRTKAGLIVGIETIPAIILKADDLEAKMIVTETNLNQRSFTDMGISERACILAEHFGDLKKSGKRKKYIKSIETCNEELAQDIASQSRDEIGKQYGLTGRDVSRLIRINYLIESLKR